MYYQFYLLCTNKDYYYYYYKSNLDLKINDIALPMTTHPKVMGLTLDPKLTYSTHIHNISVQAHTPLQMIKKHSQQQDGVNRRGHS